MYNFIGLYPLDNQVDFTQKPQKIAHDIFIANVQLIHECDIVIANLNPFRGKEADSGTIWECGYAHGMGKKVYGYMNNTQEYIQNFSPNEIIHDKTHGILDTNHRIIENFSLPINLMIGCSIENIIEGSFEDVLKAIG